MGNKSTATCVLSPQGNGGHELIDSLLVRFTLEKQFSICLSLVGTHKEQYPVDMSCRLDTGSLVSLGCCSKPLNRKSVSAVCVEFDVTCLLAYT